MRIAQAPGTLPAGASACGGTRAIPAQAGEIVRRSRQQCHRHHGAVADQAAHHAADAGQLVEAQAQTAFEQDQRDRQRHYRKQQLAQQAIRIQHSANRSEQDAGQKQEQDCWKTQAPGQPLRQETDAEHAREHQAEFEFHPRSLKRRCRMICELGGR
jgi:hypothetical protein